MARECKLGVACGKKGIGKTYITTKLLEDYVKEEMVILLEEF